MTRTTLLILMVVALGACGKADKGGGGMPAPEDSTWGWLEEDTVGNEPSIDAGDPGTPELIWGDPDSAEPAADGGDDDGVPTPDVVQPPEDCEDLDGDGYGPGCYIGNDCDDGNPHFNVYCPPCEYQTTAGCPCEQANLVEFCYEGDPAEVGIGVCALGERYCDGQYWSECLGQAVATPEACNGLDDDCDGQTDEGVLSPCGDCDPMCDTLKAGPNSENPFVPTDENSDGVGLNLDGFLILDSTKLNLAFIWVANSGEATVSKLDTETGQELGRYHACGSPSRTAVDLYGNAWVGCRSDGGVMKIAIDEALCYDLNGNGVIDTSNDANGDNQIQPNEMLPFGQDECVMFTVYPGGSCARALGVDADNHVWVGMWSQMKLRRLTPETGDQTHEVSIPGNPYGLVLDGEGVIWVSGRGGNKLIRVDPNVDPPEVTSWTPPCGSLYGITVDMLGKVWIGHYSDHCITRFDPLTNQFSTITQNLGSHCPRGMAGSTDGYMYSGLGCSGSQQIAKVDINTLQVSLVDISPGSTPIGVALDSNGYVWAVNNSTSNATKVNPHTGEKFGPYPVGQGPYTYSDMTGYALQNFTAPQGSYTTTLGGWSEIRVKWESLWVNAEVPAGANIMVEVRTAMTEEALAVTPWQGMFGPFPPDTFPLDLSILPAMDGKYLEVRLWLFSEDKASTPVVKEIQAQFNADG
jgi:streptogramin lyase